MHHIIKEHLKCSQCGDVDNYETRIRPTHGGQWQTKLICLGCGHIYEPPKVTTSDHTEMIVYTHNVSDNTKEF